MARGDRKDGRLVRTLPGMSKVIPFIMKTRNDANNIIKDRVEISEVEKYIKEKRAEGYSQFGLLHFTIAAYIRTVAERPGVNRFCSGQRVYKRDQVILNMVVKKEMTLESEDTTIKVYFDPADTAIDVYNKLQDAIEHEKGGSDDNSTEAAINTLIKFPRGFFRFAIGFLRFLDYYGKLPMFLINLSPFHGSIFFTSMGSLGIPPIVHHLYNFGNVPVFLAAGIKETVYELNKDGEVEKKKYMGYTFNVDERICDGFYFASALKVFKAQFRNPWKLDQPAVPKKDID